MDGTRDTRGPKAYERPAVRRKHGLTRARPADRMNVSESTVRRIETGRTRLMGTAINHAPEAGARATITVTDAEETGDGHGSRTA